MRFAAAIALLIGACGLKTVGSAPPEEAPRDGGTGLPEATPAPPLPDAMPAPEGELTVTQERIPARVDLTKEGTLDWMHWGTAARKATGDGIFDYTTLPTWTREFATLTGVDFSWTDGTPVANESGTNAYSYLNGADNLSATVLVRATREKRVARFYVGGKDSAVEFSLSLIDRSAPSPPPVRIDQAGSFLVRLVVRFAATTDDTRLELVGKLITRHRSDSSIRFSAASLANP